MIDVIAYNGDSWAAPASTIEGIWAGFGAGCEALCLDVFLTQDNEVVCAPSNDLKIVSGEEGFIHEKSLSEVQQLDAGATWRSTELDRECQPTGRVGEDLPWSIQYSKRRIKLAALNDVLRLVGRRTTVYLRMTQAPQSTLNQLGEQLQAILNRFGLSSATPIIAPSEACLQMRSEGYPGLLVTDLTSVEQLTPVAIEELGILNSCDGLLAWAEHLVSIESVQDLRALTGGAPVPWIAITKEAVSPKPEVLQGLLDFSEVLLGVIAKGGLPTVQQLYPVHTVMEDSFQEGTNIDRNLWTAGYSHNNKDTKIYQDDGLHIDLVQGGSYSGAAAVTCDSYHGDFDVVVDFHVENPHQGTTFEMAAIGIDPGYFFINNTRISSKRVNLTFDVHGAPPYASSERDEDDGFRLGWNNSFNLTKTDADWTSSSLNMYNKYRRDVGNGEASSPSGTLRLVRTGEFFTSYYQDKFNPGSWVCSGTAIVQNLPNEVYVRLAAKHWKKSNPEPPKNHITFTNFKLRQH